MDEAACSKLLTNLFCLEEAVCVACCPVCHFETDVCPPVCQIKSDIHSGFETAPVCHGPSKTLCLGAVSCRREEAGVTAAARAICATCTP